MTEAAACSQVGQVEHQLAICCAGCVLKMLQLTCVSLAPVVAAAAVFVSQWQSRPHIRPAILTHSGSSQVLAPAILG
jgi:hypothetical protein